MIHTFTPFDRDPTVCDTCGDLVGNHAQTAVEAAFVRDMWKVMVKHGGVWNQYTENVDNGYTYELRDHLGFHVPDEIWKGYYKNGKPMKRADKPCEMDFSMITVPVFEEQAASVFNGTFATHDSYACGVTGILYCKCGQYFYKPIILPNKTIGQLIWLVTREAEAVS